MAALRLLKCRNILTKPSLITSYANALIPVCQNVRRYSSSELTNKSDASETLPASTDDESDDLAVRDVSRMPKEYRDRMTHIMNPPERPNYIGEMYETVAQKQKLYAKYGKRSGVDPGYLWPSMKQLSEQIEFEKEWEPTLQQMKKNIDEDTKADAVERQKKRELVQKQMAKMPQLIKEFRTKLTKAESEERAQDEKRKALLEEARDFFGYDIDPRDPRFEQMKLAKEEEEKKLKKQRKKEEKIARWMESVKQNAK